MITNVSFLSIPLLPVPTYPSVNSLGRLSAAIFTYFSGPNGPYPDWCNSYFVFIMYASIVHAQACNCFTVMFTDLKTWDRYVFPHFLSFKDASVKALEYQALMDPSRKSFDFRVHQCS